MKTIKLYYEELDKMYQAAKEGRFDDEFDHRQYCNDLLTCIMESDNLRREFVRTQIIN